MVYAIKYKKKSKFLASSSWFVNLNFGLNITKQWNIKNSRIMREDWPIPFSEVHQQIPKVNMHTALTSNILLNT